MNAKLVIALGLSLLPSLVMAADSIKEAQKHVLSCNENITGADVKLRVETTYTTSTFGGSSSNDVTKRVMEITVGKQTARSVIQSPAVPPNITWNEILKFPFLRDDYVGADGVEYRYQGTLVDKNNNQFPAELLRLKAFIPKANRVFNGGPTTSGFSVNLLMPESRLQNGKFEASAYVDYSLEGNTKDDFTIGLAALECSQTDISLEPAKVDCLSKEDEQEIKNIKEKIAAAKIQHPDCEQSWGAAACISPREQVELRYLKSETVKCQ